MDSIISSSFTRRRLNANEAYELNRTIDEHFGSTQQTTPTRSGHFGRRTRAAVPKSRPTRLQYEDYDADDDGTNEDPNADYFRTPNRTANFDNYPVSTPIDESNLGYVDDNYFEDVSQIEEEDGGDYDATEQPSTRVDNVAVVLVDLLDDIDEPRTDNSLEPGFRDTQAWKWAISHIKQLKNSALPRHTRHKLKRLLARHSPSSIRNNNNNDDDQQSDQDYRNEPRTDRLAALGFRDKQERHWAMARLKQLLELLHWADSDNLLNRGFLDTPDRHGAMARLKQLKKTVLPASRQLQLNYRFLNDRPVTAQELCADPMLGIDNVDEADTWNEGIGRDIVRTLNGKQVKRQELIYELIITEKRLCQVLLIMQKVFLASLRQHFGHLNFERLFPRLDELIDLHTGFLRRLRQRQRERPLVDSVADILIEFFSGRSAQRLVAAYADFCSNHQTAMDTFKHYEHDEPALSEWHKHMQTNPVLKRKGIQECTLWVVQRLTKYPILIEDQLKTVADTDAAETDRLRSAIAMIKDILVNVNAKVDENEMENRQYDMFRRIDPKSFVMYKQKKFERADIVSNRELRFDGVASLVQGRSKMQTVTVVLLTDCLLFLQEHSNNKYSFFTADNRVAVVPLQNLMVQESGGAGTDEGICIRSSDASRPETFELIVQSPRDRNVWIDSISAAVSECS